MADPFTALSIGATVAGGAVSAFGASESGEAKSNAALYQSGVASINSQIASQNADYIRNTGEIDARRSGMQTADIIAKQKVAQSGSGVSLNSSSSQAVIGSTHEIGVEDQGTIRANATRKAYGFDVQAAGLKDTAAMDVAEASNDRKSGTIGAITSILGSAASVASKWSAGKQSGLFGSGATDDTDPWAGMREVS